MKIKIVIALIFPVMCGINVARAADLKLDGAYRLVLIKTPNGTQTEENVKGMMVVHGKYMAFVRASVDRKTWSQEEPADERMKKIVAAYQGLAATCGSFEIQGNTLTLNQLAQASPASMGTPSKWELRVDGNKLSIKPQANLSVEFLFERLP